MFPKPPDLRSESGASTWAWVRDLTNPGNLHLVQSQWVTVVQRFQALVKEVFQDAGVTRWTVGPSTTATLERASGTVTVGTMAQGDPEGEYLTAEMAADGAWNLPTLHALRALLLFEGDFAGADAAARDNATFRVVEDGGDPAGSLPRFLSAETTRAVLAHAFFASPSDFALFSGTPVVASARVTMAGVTLDPGALLPVWVSAQMPNAADLNWYQVSEAGQPLPNPPSRVAKFGATRPWSTSPAKGVLDDLADVRDELEDRVNQADASFQQGRRAVANIETGSSVFKLAAFATAAYLALTVLD